MTQETRCCYRDTGDYGGDTRRGDPRRGGGDGMIDGATAEVVRSYLGSAAEEMRATLIRTAFNPVIYEVLDFGISIYDGNLDLIAEALGMCPAGEPATWREHP
jgi:hypothetical protein